MAITVLALAAALHATTPDTLAITNVAVLSMTVERVDSDQTVVIVGNRIVASGPASQVVAPRNARVIDGRGKYLLPGLVDMHVHMTTSAELPMYVGYGVLAVRDMNGAEQTLRWRDSVQRGLLAGPRIFASGPMMAGREIPWRNKVVPTSAAEAVDLVREQHRAGFDQIKLYDGLPREAFVAAVAEAARLGMKSSGHIPSQVGFAGVLQSGMSSLEHLDKTLFDVFGHDVDTLRLPAVARQIRQSGVWVTPTLASMIELSYVASGRFDSLMARPAVTNAPPELRDFWGSITGRIRGNRVLPPGAKYDRWTTLQMRFAGELARAGVPLLAGSDLPNAVLVPGLAIHEELAALVEAGLSPYQALEAATAAPSRFFGTSTEWGTVAAGQRANLLLVDANPLVDLSVLARPRGAVLEGRWIDADALMLLRRER